MARGNRIIVSSEPQGKFTEGYVKSGNTFQPGMVVERDPSVALSNGRHTYKYANPGADGGQPKGAYWIVTDMLHWLIGKAISDTIAAGERVVLYSPMAGEEINLLLLNIAGTADDHALGEVLIVKDNVGKFIATASTPDSKCAQLLEVVTDPIADTLAWCQWAGK